MDWKKLLETLQEQFKSDPAKAIATVQHLIDAVQGALNLAKANPELVTVLIGLIPTPK